MKKKERRKNFAQAVSSRHALLLVILCLAVYANGLTGTFVWDDQMQLFRNPNIRSLENIPRAFTGSLWSFMYSDAGGIEKGALDLYYRPIQTVIYILVYKLAGLSPFAYHLTNVILHCAATFLVYLLCLELGIDSFSALLAVSLFAVHPVHTEAVTWIAGVGDLSCGVFYFAALLLFFRYLRLRKSKWLWLSSLSFLGALFSKEMAVTFPIIVLLTCLARKEERENLKGVARIMFPYGLAFATYAGFRLAAVGFNAVSGTPLQASLLDWTTLGIWAVGEYVRYSFFPYPLYVQHLPPLHLADRFVSTSVYAALIAMIAGTLVMWRRKFFDQLLWLMIFLITLIPVLYFKGISTLFAERYLYIPSMAFILAVASLLPRLNRTPAMLGTLGVVVVFSVLTIQRNRDWQNEQTLFERTLNYQPNAVNLWSSLGEAYLREGDDVRAEQHFQSGLHYIENGRFVKTPYESYRIHHGLGLAAVRQGRVDEAISNLQKAIELYPQGDAAYTTLAGVLISRGTDYAKAISLLETAMNLNPVNELARDYLGVALVNQGQVERGIAYFRQALEINPELESAKQHLELALRARKSDFKTDAGKTP